MRTLLSCLLGLGSMASVAFAQQTEGASVPPDESWQTEAFDEWSGWDEEEESASPWTLAGFFETAGGQRLSNDPAVDRRRTLADVRVQLQASYALEASSLNFRSDLYYDGVKDNVEIQVREALWQGRLAFLGEWGENFDIKAGQQVLTWGTGDYLFLNDLFPKDWQSFFSGRDDEYLKAPSFSVKLSGYFDALNFDFVVTPRFTPDIAITGEYFSFYLPPVGMNLAPEFVVADENRPEGAEIAVRLYKTLGQTEVAAYGYRGYNKSPFALDAQFRPRYTRLNVWGASAVRPLAAGLAKFEYAYHDAIDDAGGRDPLIPNSQSRWLIGYEQELVANLTGSVQWYSEHIHDHAALLSASLWPQDEPPQRRDMLTTQLMYRALQQTLTLHWFNFYSPNEDDGYMRLRVTYSPADEWQVNGGFNWFYGDEMNTFFGQFEDASNVFAAFRYFY